MLFGCCVNMLPREGNDPGIRYAPEVKQAGFDYVELPIGQMAGLGEVQFEEAVAFLKDVALPVHACNSLFPGEIKLVGPEVDRSRVREHYHRAMERAQRLGSHFVVFGSPDAKACPEGFSGERAFEQLVEWCREMGPVARAHNITIALEANNRTETNMINLYSEAIALAKAADHPNILCLQDYFHLGMEGDTVDSMLRHGRDYLVHTHFARIEKRGFPASKEEDPYYQVFFDALKQMDYQGGLSMEGFPKSRESFLTEATQTCRFLRSCAREAGL